MDSRVSVAGVVLSIVGGVFVLLTAVLLLVAESIVGGFGFLFPGLVALTYVGLLMGLLMIVVAVIATLKPDLKVAWGALIIVFSIVSIPAALGGFFLGFILGLIGGILILVKKPEPTMQPYPTPMPMGTPAAPAPATAARCAACGGAIDPNTRTCTSCGKPAA